MRWITLFVPGTNGMAGDLMPVYGKEEKTDEGKAVKFSGKRIRRGLYRHWDGTVSNADINGAANILRYHG